METQLLRLLLGGVFVQKDWQGVEWNRLLTVAQKNLILIRTGALFQKNGLSLPAHFSDTLHQEEDRIKKVSKLIKRISNLCAVNQISFLLPTALQHFPDMGGDIDVLVSNGSRQIDSLLSKEFQVRPLPKDLFSFISTESSFFFPSYGTSIEVRHGRLGLMGEHRLLTAILFKNMRKTLFEDAEISIPSDEDQLLIQTTQRLYERFYFRMSDLIRSVQLIKNQNLDWDYIFSAADQMGIREGLNLYLGYVSKIHYDLFGKTPVVLPAKRVPVKIDNVNFTFKNNYFRYPFFLITVKLYWKKWMSDLLSGRLKSALRLCVLPPVTLTFLLRNLRGKQSRYFQQS